MNSMDDLLHLVHSDGADGLGLRVGHPPVIVLDGEELPMEGPPLTTQDAERLWRSISDTRQRRRLREQGAIEFIYRFRAHASFVVRAKLEDGNVRMAIH